MLCTDVIPRWGEELETKAINQGLIDESDRSHEEK